MSFKKSRFKKSALITVVVLIGLLGLALVAVRAYDIQAPHYRHVIAQRISTRLQVPVSIGNLDLDWSWRGPVVRLDDVHVSRGKALNVRIPQLELHFSLLDLARGQRLPDGLIAHQAHVALRLDGTPSPRPQTRQTDTPAFGWSSVQHLRELLDHVALDEARITLTRTRRHHTRRIRLTHVNASVSDTGDALTIHASSRLQAAPGRLRLKARIVGTLPDFRKARVSLSGKHIAPLMLWRTLAAKTAPRELTGGQAGLKLTARWRDHAFQHAALQLDTAAVRAQPDTRPLLPALHARFEARPAQTDTDIINLTLQSLSGAGGALARMHASARLNTATRSLTLRARNIAASLLTPLLRQRLPALQQARLHGMIDHIELTLATDTPLQAAVAFSGLGIEAQDFAAGTVSGTFYRNGTTNVVRFSGADGRLRSTRYLRGKLPITGLTGQLNWHSTEHGVQLRATDLDVSSASADMTLNGTLSIPEHGVPSADLRTHITTADASVPLSHVPQTQDMPFDRLRDWLPKAIRAGRVAVDAYLRGPLDHMFAGEGKHLGVTINGSGFDLQYKPEWPRLTQAAGTITLRGDTLAVDLQHGQILGVAIDAASIHVDDVRDPVLLLDGAIDTGPTATMLSFLAKSPLQERFGKLVDAIDVDGEAGLELELRLPLKDDLGELKVSGTIHAHGDRLDHEALPAPIKAIRGTLHFSKDGLRAQDLQGSMLGIALTTDITPAADKRIDITSHGRISLPRDNALLAHYLPAEWLDFAHGSAIATVNLQLSTSGDISGVSVTSDLNGMALELPKPLHKAAATTRRFKLAIHEGGRLRLQYADATTIDMDFDDHDLRRAVIMLGNSTDGNAPSGPGIWLGGRVAILPLRRWLDVARTLTASTSDKDKAAHSTTNDGSGNGSSGQLPFLGADLHIGALRLGARQLNDLHLQVTPLANVAGWKIDLTGPNAQGNATWRPAANGHSALRAHFDRLHLEPLPPEAATSIQSDTAKSSEDAVISTLDPRQLPILDVRIEQLRIGSVDFGRAVVDAQATDNGWRLTQAILSGGVLSVQAKGRWQRKVGMTSGQLDLSVHGQGLATALRALGYDPGIRARKVSAQARLQFMPSEQGLDLAALNGHLSIHLQDGVIASIKPGAGRLLGLLNLYALPRRLMLDFSDVTSEGLSFDTIGGDFDIVSGDAFSDNLTIKTTAANIRIVGRVGLATRDYDQTVTIMPKFSSSLTLAGTVLGGPVVGAAVFALQQLLAVPIQKASSIQYQVHGSWGNPKIVNPHAKE